METKKIIISVTSDLSTDHRVQKTTQTLYEAGFDVLLIGRKTRKSLPFQAEYPFRQFRLLFNSSFLFYAEYNIRLFFLLLFTKADIFLANDLDTLLANCLASRIKKKKIVYDTHELFTEVPELNGRNFVKCVWKKIEKYCIPMVNKSFTVCQSIADFYNQKYNTTMKVVRNVPSCVLQKNGTSKLSFPGKKIILYQGALNIGRGIEWIINAMPLIKNAVLIIIGEGDISNDLKLQVEKKKLQNQVFFLGRISCKELPTYTIAADLGLCLLNNNSLSYYYSLPNRIFDFMYAKVPILASDFPEIKNIVKNYQIGKIVNNYQPEFLAKTISKMLNEKIADQNFENAIANFNWENEKKVLLSLF